MFIFSKKLSLFILLSIFAFFILAQPAGAVDQRCWKKTACESDKGKFFGPNSETIKACLMEEDASGVKIGFCTPGYTAETQVDFGGRKSFSNFGDFIKWIYQYGVMIAGIFAVVMIINNGLKWVISGGSPEKIAEARKRIAQSLMGLFIVVLSYFILNAVNPYLVNMRLPQVWKINTIGLVPPYCDQVKGKMLSDKSGGQFTTEPADAKCGIEYYVEGGGEVTCFGSVCDEGSLCMPSEKKDPKTKKEIRVCQQGVLGGGVSSPKSLMCSDLTGNIIDSSLTLIAVCKETSFNYNLEEVVELTLPTGARSYLFEPTVINKIKNACSNRGGVVGFYLGADVNDEGGGLGGQFCPGVMTASGIDDWFAIGKSAPGSHLCSSNLAKVAFDIFMPRKPDCANQGPRDCSCGTLSQTAVVKKLIQNSTYIQYLFTKEELLGGYFCDIIIDRNNFPALDNTATWNNMKFDTDCFWGQTIVDIGSLWKTAALLE